MKFENLRMVYYYPVSWEKYKRRPSLIHASENGDITLCGKETDGNWFLDDFLDGSNTPITCKKCLRAIEKGGCRA